MSEYLTIAIKHTNDDNFNCEVITLYTDDSRKLNFLQWTSEERELTSADLMAIDEFYEDEIAMLNKIITDNHEAMIMLRASLVSAKAEIYPLICEDIEERRAESRSAATDRDNDIAQRAKFELLSYILKENKEYKLVYTKC